MGPEMRSASSRKASASMRTTLAPVMRFGLGFHSQWFKSAGTEMVTNLGYGKTQKAIQLIVFVTPRVLRLDPALFRHS